MTNYESIFNQISESIKAKAEKCALSLEASGFQSDVSLNTDEDNWAFVIDVKNHPSMPRISFVLHENDYSDGDPSFDPNNVYAHLSIVGFGGEYIGEMNGKETQDTASLISDFESFSDVGIVSAIQQSKTSSLKSKTMN